MVGKSFFDEPKYIYTTRSRSVRILGQTTSIRLENKYWEILDEISEKERLSRGELISFIYAKALDEGMEFINFTSLLRIICVIYIENKDRIEVKT